MKIKAISFDLWDTLILSNPEFKKQQKKLVSSLDIGISADKWEADLIAIKQKINQQVVETGLHFDRNAIYKQVFIRQSLEEIAQFIAESNRLFLQYPPLLKDTFEVISYLKDKGITCYICSNTVLIYGDILQKIIQDYFGIAAENCHFSDVLGISKPNPKMFLFPIQTQFHLGDNPITDGACINAGIAFYHIYQHQNFRSFLSHANL